MLFLNWVLPGTLNCCHGCQGSYQSLRRQYAMETDEHKYRHQNINPKDELCDSKDYLLRWTNWHDWYIWISIFNSVKCKLSLKKTKAKKKHKTKLKYKTIFVWCSLIASSYPSSQNTNNMHPFFTLPIHYFAKEFITVY